jgi:enamine deaminase RidA (YjgF/YER057c/UK114 family)
MRKKISSGAPWEKKVGYARAVRVDNVIEISGTVSLNENGELVGDNYYDQAFFIIQKIEEVLVQAGASLKDVVRTRIYTTDIAKWEDIGKAHGQFFKDIQPATSMVEVSNLIDKKFLVEIEATAIISI